MSDEAKTTKITIRKDQDRAAGKSIETMTNGLRETLAVGQEIEVSDHTLETLRHSNVQFDVVGEDGVSSSTAPLTDTATRDRPNIDPLAAADGDGKPREVPELGEGGAPGVAGAVAPAQEYDVQLAATNAEGQGAGADGTDQSGAQSGPETDTASRTADETAQANEAKEADDEGSPALKTLESLKTHLGGDVSKDDAKKLLDEEVSGKNRVGAVEALEAHIAKSE